MKNKIHKSYAVGLRFIIPYVFHVSYDHSICIAIYTVLKLLEEKYFSC